VGRGGEAGSGWLEAVGRAWARLSFFLKPPVDNAASLLGNTTLALCRGRSSGSDGATGMFGTAASSEIHTTAGEDERDVTGGPALPAFFFLADLATGSLGCATFVFFGLGTESPTDASLALFVLWDIFADTPLAMVGLAIVGGFVLVGR
jgi:hypothetical protein